MELRKYKASCHGTHAGFVFISVWFFNIIRFFRLYETVCIAGVCYMPVESLCRILTCLVSRSHSTLVSHTLEVFSFYSSGEDFSALYHLQRVTMVNSFIFQSVEIETHTSYNVFFKQLKDLPDFEKQNP